MIGMNDITGEALSGEAHIRQSIKRILFTPLGSRVWRPSFGSRLVSLLGAPLNDKTRLAIYTATAEALAIWEKRIELTRVGLQANEKGIAELIVQFTNLETGNDADERFETEAVI